MAYSRGAIRKVSRMPGRGHERKLCPSQPAPVCTMKADIEAWRAERSLMATSRLMPCSMRQNFRTSPIEPALISGGQRRVALLSASTAHREISRRIGRRIAVAVGLALSQAAVAAPPDNQNPALAPWFESLRQPGTGASCCSIADCRAVEFRQDRDGYEVLIDGRWKMSSPFWLRVPPNRIIDRTDNPTNRAVVCFTPEAGILCFVRPAES